MLANRKIDKIAGGNAIPSQHKKSGIIVFTRFFLLRVTADPRSIPLILLHHSYHTELDNWTSGHVAREKPCTCTFVPPSVAEQTSNPLDCKTGGVPA